MDERIWGSSPPAAISSLFTSFRLVLFIFAPSRSFVRDIMCVKYRPFLPTPPSSWALLENTFLPYEEGTAIHACPRWEFFLPHFLHIAVVLRSLSTSLISLIKEAWYISNDKLWEITQMIVQSSSWRKSRWAVIWVINHKMLSTCKFYVQVSEIIKR